jgi:stage V sporulation protein AF
VTKYFHSGDSEEISQPVPSGDHAAVPTASSADDAALAGQQEVITSSGDGTVVTREVYRVNLTEGTGTQEAGQDQHYIENNNLVAESSNPGQSAEVKQEDQKQEPEKQEAEKQEQPELREPEQRKQELPEQEPPEKPANYQDAVDSDQDTSRREETSEASDELGMEDPDRTSAKGFFAKLFGFDDDDDEDWEDEDQEEDEQSREKLQAHSPKKKEKKLKLSAEQHSQEQAHKEDPLRDKREHERADSLEGAVIYWQGNDDIPTSLDKTKDTITEVMGLGSSFDVIFREMTFGGRKSALLCLSGFAKVDIIDEILKRLTILKPEDVKPDIIAEFMSSVPHIQVSKVDKLSETLNKVLMGMSAIFFEDESTVILIDSRSYPVRSPDEPTIERVVRGARDGFTETLLSNVTLVRRRIRDPGLKLEMQQIGQRTRTDVCIAYIDDIVDMTQVNAVKEKIKKVKLDGIPMADKQLEEAIIGKGWNPYPMVRYSERPDVVASHLLEGRVVLFVDTSPSVMVLPTNFFDLCLHAEENRQTPFIGTYLRWVRFMGIFASMFLLPLWMLLVIHPELKPPMLEFIGPQKMAKIPLLAQFLLIEIGVDLLRMAAVHTPTPLGSAMGLISAILIGDIAVQTGLFVNEVVLYMAVAAIGMFATPSYELGLANRIVRLVLLLAVSAFQVPGFVIGSTLVILLLTFRRSYNSSYLWPFIPFNAKAMGHVILRPPVLNMPRRPAFNKTNDSTRVPKQGTGKKHS